MTRNAVSINPDNVEGASTEPVGNRPAHREPASGSSFLRSPSPAWMKWLLLAAGAYNIAWGLFAIVAPKAPFLWAGLDAPNYPSLWQCIGMIVGVYGIGYAIAAFDPVRHWPIVLVGLLGKIFGPIGFVWTAYQGELPWAIGLTILTNDLIWWLPFILILRHAARPYGPAIAAEARERRHEAVSLRS